MAPSGSSKRPYLAMRLVRRRARNSGTDEPWPSITPGQASRRHPLNRKLRLRRAVLRLPLPPVVPGPRYLNQPHMYRIYVLRKVYTADVHILPWRRRLPPPPLTSPGRAARRGRRARARQVSRSGTSRAAVPPARAEPGGPPPHTPAATIRPQSRDCSVERDGPDLVGNNTKITRSALTLRGGPGRPDRGRWRTTPSGSPTGSNGRDASVPGTCTPVGEDPARSDPCYR
jgi:hypothetical protein